MADEYPGHICVHRIESNGMILLGDLVLDIYEQVPMACHVSTIVRLKLALGVVKQAWLWQSISTKVRKQGSKCLYWYASWLRSRVNLYFHHHGTWLPWHPDGHICDYLRPIVWVSICVQPLTGLTLSIGALRQSKKTCYMYLLLLTPFLKGLGLIHCLLLYLSLNRNGPSLSGTLVPHEDNVTSIAALGV